MRSKKTILVITICGMFLVAPLSARAATIEELTAQIQSLLAVVLSLQQQLTQQTGTPTTSLVPTSGVDPSSSALERHNASIQNEPACGNGNDFYDGGTGEDTLNYSGTRAEFHITQHADGSFTFRDLVPCRADNDTVVNVELFAFSDGTLTQNQLSPDAHEKGINSTAVVNKCLTLKYNMWPGINDLAAYGEVTKLQRFLTQTGDYTYGEVTGYYGNATAGAVRRFQCRKGVVCGGSAADTGYGLVGSRTRQALNTQCEATKAPTFTEIQQNQWVRYENKNVGFYASYPPEWKVIRESGPYSWNVSGKVAFGKRGVTDPNYDGEIFVTRYHSTSSQQIEGIIRGFYQYKSSPRVSVEEFRLAGSGAKKYTVTVPGNPPGWLLSIVWIPLSATDHLLINDGGAVDSQTLSRFFMNFSPSSSASVIIKEPLKISSFTGPSVDSTIPLTVGNGGGWTIGVNKKTANITIDWGDGQRSEYTISDDWVSSMIHAYSSPGTYTAVATAYLGGESAQRSLQVRVVDRETAANALFGTSVETLDNLALLRMKARDSRRVSDLKQIQLALEFYYDDNGVYPPGSDVLYTSSSYHSLDVLTPQYISTLPVDPEIGTKYSYNVLSGGSSYVLRATFETQGHSSLLYDIDGVFVVEGANISCEDKDLKFCVQP